VEVRDLRRQDLAAARALLAGSCAFDDAAAVAEEKLFEGPGEPLALGAWRGDELIGVAAVAGRWLRLLAVQPGARRRGVGGALLDACCARARAAGETRLRAGGQPGNYLAPGVDERDDETIAFLVERGFRVEDTAQNLQVPFAGNALVRELPAPAGYRVGDGGGADVLACARGFSAAWEYEVARAQRGGGVHAAWDAQGLVVAFAAHDGNNQGLGWFGPAGTAPAHRGKGLGAVLLQRCLAGIRARHDRAVIAWIGPAEFYAKVCGAALDRTFQILERPL
jgi:GNAT superfamily N-acetyltransferase